MRVKQDAIPGMMIIVSFAPTAPFPVRRRTSTARARAGNPLQDARVFAASRGVSSTSGHEPGSASSPDRESMSRQLILASASPRRAELLTSAGFGFEVAPAEVDETPHAEEAASDYVIRVARDKARHVAETRKGTGAVVLAADTAVVTEAGSWASRAATRTPRACWRRSPARSIRCSPESLCARTPASWSSSLRRGCTSCR